jgi:two-component system, NtrC family, sensor kinase
LRAPTPLRRELLIVFGALFAGAVLVAGIGLAVLLPTLSSTTESVLFVAVLVAADLVVIFAFGGAFLRRTFVEPMERLAGDARRIAEGDYHHRIGGSERLELDQLSQSVNAMADRLIADQELLAENVASLDRTNRELIEARDQVVHSARLASVGTLAAGIAHEVGNPLGAVIAFVDVAKARLEREGIDTELLGSIRAEATRIDRIVRGLLDYARPREVSPEAADPADVLQRVRALLETQGKMDRLESRWNVDADVPRVVMEPHRLEQVMVNLILNAIDALEGREHPRVEIDLAREPGGVSRLPTRRAQDPPGINYMHRRRVSRDEGGRGIDPLFNAREVVLIRVSDNGPGIPEVDLESVFDPFFTTKEPGRGTGLGLSICARLVEGMGGRIEVENRAEGGACFMIRLPGIPESGLSGATGPDEAPPERAEEPVE